MSNIKDKPNRHSIRLREYDYSSPGWYYITICTHQQACIFGNIKNGKMVLSPIGKIAQEYWVEIPDHFKHIELDEFVVMPNHIHGIIIINDNRRDTACRVPTNQFGKPVPGSLPTIIRSYKSAVTKQINERRKRPGKKLWQRNFYEHIIRNDKELPQIRKYIIDNPMKWQLDNEHPRHRR